MLQPAYEDVERREEKFWTFFLFILSTMHRWRHKWWWFYIAATQECSSLCVRAICCWILSEIDGWWWKNEVTVMGVMVLFCRWVKCFKRHDEMIALRGFYGLFESFFLVFGFWFFLKIILMLLRGFLVIFFHLSVKIKFFKLNAVKVYVF